MAGLNYYVPSMRRRNALGHIFEGHDPSAQLKLQNIYIGNLEAKAAFDGGLEEKLESLPMRKIEEDGSVVHSARFRQRRNAVVSSDMADVKGQQWLHHVTDMIDALPIVRKPRGSSTVQPVFWINMKC